MIHVSFEEKHDVNRRRRGKNRYPILYLTRKKIKETLEMINTFVIVSQTAAAY